MKILMIAVFSPTSTNNSQADGFEHWGHEIIRYDYREKATKLGNSNRDNDIIKICETETPDIVFFSKCNEIDVRVVKECNKISKTVLWYMDPKNGNFNSSLKDKIKHCHYTFCALVEPCNESKKYSNNVYFLQEGFNDKVDKKFDVDYKHDVSFIGDLRGERRRYFNKIRFHNYTNVFNEQHAIAVSETKINLNFTEGGTSDRTYKILAAGGFLLTQPWANIEKDFRIGTDLDVFESEAELEEKIIYYLANEDERKRISESGFEVVQKFNRSNFAKRLLEVISD